MFEKLVPYDTAYLILEAYMRYYFEFKKITKRAKIRFEHRDWHGMQSDMKERLNLYRDVVGATKEPVQVAATGQGNDRAFWVAVKQMYLEEIRNFNTRNIAETFYNSVFRHSHPGLSADAETMFVHSTGNYREFKSTHPFYHTLDFTKSIISTLERLMSLYPFDAKFEDQRRDIKMMEKVLEKKLNQLNVNWEYLRIEVLRSVFYRNKAAYIVGRLYIHDSPIPFIIPMLHQEKGVFVDALLLNYDDVSPIFSYNRMYFLADVDIVIETVDFIESILPTKRLDELYNSIGFVKHGKTVFYRQFQRHLVRSNDQYIIAPGIKGMVMSVFTLPSYNVVFKLIKDEFEPPKNMTEEEVKQKYELVTQHDRVGRMTDFHMFENLVFDKRRFHADLIEELKTVAPSKLNIKGNQLTLKHLYVEKRMTPLDIFLRQATEEEAHLAIKDYGKAIKELAAANIFPGDMLLKNFGVTRLKRIVFYDYDEIGFLTDYNFREFPEPRNEYEEMSSEPYFHVGENDVFPEEFTRFLIGDAELRKIFYKYHKDLYGIRFWRRMQSRLRKGEIVDVFPYADNVRFVNKFRGQRKQKESKAKK